MIHSDRQILHSYSQTSHDIAVSVVPTFVPEKSNQRDIFFFQYEVKISNTSKKPIQLLSRHWIIRSGDGEIQEVKGKGVVGECPFIGAGETYSYKSFCPLPVATGNMRGSFGIIDHQGQHKVIKIPLFFLRPD